MDRLKFRAWGHFGSDTSDKMVLDWEDDELIGDLGLNGRGFFKVMQCTGLKDQNDKLIFEGDIVKYWISNRNGEWENVKEVKYIICCFGVSSHSGFVIISDINKKCEIIGNIYENPELLETK